MFDKPPVDHLARRRLMPVAIVIAVLVVAALVADTVNTAIHASDPVWWGGAATQCACLVFALRWLFRIVGPEGRTDSA
jgi:hypothetical protein